MKPRPSASIGRVLDDLGTTLLELIGGDPERPGDIGGVVIYDPLDEPALPRNALVLGVGLREAGQIAGLLRTLGGQQAAGLVVRMPVAGGDEVAGAARDSGVVLLGLTRGASWAQLAALLRSMLAEGDVGDAGPQTLGGIPSGDLFAVANAVAALLDAPVTIEDRSSRVLAFSGRQDEADQSRVETILGRQVPEKYARLLTERGVFRDLYRSDNPVYIEPPPGAPPDFRVPRVAVAVRAGDEVLGSIWAAVRQPLSPARLQAMGEASRLVALHMLRIRAGADVHRRLRADLVSTALEGGAGASDALSRLGLAGQPVVVLALALAPAPGSSAGHATERQRLGDGLAMHLSAVYPRSATALVGDVVYALVPASCDSAGQERASQVAAAFLDRVGDRVRALIGISQAARDAAAIAAARANADRALRVLRVLRGGKGGQRVASIADVHVEALLLELRDLSAARGDAPAGPLARLAAYDEEHNANLVQTLRAWLDAFGDIAAAAAAVYVHPNTFRYRLRRARDVGGLNLDDPEARFAAMLQLRLLQGPRTADS